MALAERLTAPPTAGTPGLPCSIGALLDNLQGAERDALQAMLADRAWSQHMIWTALHEEGHTVGKQSINRHRGGKCRCTA